MRCWAEAVKRLRRMRADVRWQQARLIPRSEQQARKAAFAALRKEFGFSEYASHAFATEANTSWIAEHLDANTAQTLASRAYQAANRVCVGKARRVRFRSSGRGLPSLEGKTNKQGIRFVLQRPEEGNQGWFVWGEERIPALIDWQDPVVQYGLRQRIKYVRLLRRKASSPGAKGADRDGYRYYAQLALEGRALSETQTPHWAGDGGTGPGPLHHCHRPPAGHGTVGNVLRRFSTQCASETAFAAQAGPPAPRQQPTAL